MQIKHLVQIYDWSADSDRNFKVSKTLFPKTLSPNGWNERKSGTVHRQICHAESCSAIGVLAELERSFTSWLGFDTTPFAMHRLR